MRMPRPSRVAAVATAALAVTLVLAGCSGVGHPSPSATALPSGISAALAALPIDAGLRQLEVEMRNEGELPLEVGLLRVEDPRFDGVASRVVNHPTQIAAGSSKGIRVQLPQMNCEAPDLGSPMVTVGFSVGAARSVAFTPLPDASDLIAAAYAQQCGEIAASAGG